SELPTRDVLLRHEGPRHGRTPRHAPAEYVVLDEGEVLEQPADRELGRRDAARAQLLDGQPVGLPAKGRSQLLERAGEVLGVGAREGRLPGSLGHGGASVRWSVETY